MRALVVYKKSAYQLYALERKDPRLLRLLRQGQADARDIRLAHEVHQATLDVVARGLRALGIRAEFVYRADLRTSARADLVISVGGDGTFLQACHVVHRAPILGVNSDPQRSEAVFCAATRHTFVSLMRRVLAGRLRTSTLYRLHVTRNRRRLAPLALNDVLIAHDDPATMSRYRLRVGPRQEAQKSSGLWIATAAGSSSAILAAGGRRLPWTAKQFQYRPRELYRGRLSRSRLTGGVLPMGASIELTWLMREGAVFVDGPHVRHPLAFGDQLVIGLSARDPLQVLGLRP